MRFSLAAVTGALLTVAPAFAQDQTVMVGMGGQRTFTPSNINATVGSKITFVFVSGNHSIAQSAFNDPCTAIPNGFHADFSPINNDTTNFPTVIMSVSQPAPIWVFCPQTIPANHCQTGMVAAINAPPDKTFETFQAAAKAQTPPPNSTAATTSGSIVPGTTGGPSTASPSTANPSAPVVSPGSTSNSTAPGKNGALSQMQGAFTAGVAGMLLVVASLL